MKMVGQWPSVPPIRGIEVDRAAERDVARGLRRVGPDADVGTAAGGVEEMARAPPMRVEIALAAGCCGVPVSISQSRSPLAVRRNTHWVIPCHRDCMGMAANAEAGSRNEWPETPRDEASEDRPGGLSRHKDNHSES